MLSDKLKVICDRLIDKRNRKVDIARTKAMAELEAIDRENDAYFDGVYDALRQVQEEDDNAREVET